MLSEIARTRSRRGARAPSRTRSHYDAILKLLRDRGSQGVLGSELYNSPEQFGRSPLNRISEARRNGHLIEGKPHGACDWFYRLIRENPKPPKPATNWEERTRVTGLPLLNLGMRR
jgi:hypothetical protein